MADTALGYLHSTPRQPGASEMNPQGYCLIKAHCQADGKKYGDGGGLALNGSEQPLYPPHSWCATFWAEVVQSPPCGARTVMWCPGGAAAGGKALGGIKDDLPVGEGVLAPSLVMTGVGHACLGGDTEVAMWVMDFGNRLGLTGTALAACNLLITTLLIFIFLSSENSPSLFIS